MTTLRFDAPAIREELQESNEVQQFVPQVVLDWVTDAQRCSNERLGEIGATAVWDDALQAAYSEAIGRAAVREYVKAENRCPDCHEALERRVVLEYVYPGDHGGGYNGDGPVHHGCRGEPVDEVDERFPTDDDDEPARVNGFGQRLRATAEWLPGDQYE